MPALKNKVAVITGGSSGIGLATAKRFVEEGAYVFITGRRQSELDKAVKEIGRNAIAIQGDISKLDDLERLYKGIADPTVQPLLIPIPLVFRTQNLGLQQRTKNFAVRKLRFHPAVE